MNTPSTDRKAYDLNLAEPGPLSEDYTPTGKHVSANHARQWEAIARRLAEALRGELGDRWKTTTEATLADFDQLAKP
jgi:hypothetical protein